VAAHARATALLRQNPETGFDAAVEEAKRVVALGPDRAAAAAPAPAAAASAGTGAPKTVEPTEPTEPAEVVEVVEVVEESEATDC
jgi:hypothetical protein